MSYVLCVMSNVKDQETVSCLTLNNRTSDIIVLILQMKIVFPFWLEIYFMIPIMLYKCNLDFLIASVPWTKMHLGICYKNPKGILAFLHHSSSL